jgi:hypothetical protein
MLGQMLRLTYGGAACPVAGLATHWQLHVLLLQVSIEPSTKRRANTVRTHTHWTLLFSQVCLRSRMSYPVEGHSCYMHCTYLQTITQWAVRLRIQHKFMLTAAY